MLHKGFKMNTTVTNEEAIAATRLWLERAVIGLNLCPFAKGVHVKNQIRYVVSAAQTTEELLRDVLSELEVLAEASREKIDTTLLIHPHVLTDFLDYNDFLAVVDAALEDIDLARPLMSGAIPPQAVTHIAVLLAYTLVAFYVSLVLFRRRLSR